MTLQFGSQNKTKDNHVCGECDKSFTFKSNLQRHQLLHANVNQHNVCEICKKNYSTKYNLQQHYLTHTQERPHVCDTCGAGFTLKRNLTRHYDLVHLVTFKDKKKKCGTLNENSPRTKKFIKYGRSLPSMHICEICNKTFSAQEYLRKHYIIHTGERPYICDICNKGFYRRMHLKYHLRTHKSKCFLCTEYFSKDNLAVHFQSHITDREPYICEICDKKFSVKNNLLEHFEQHSNLKEKHFICEFCNREFVQACRLKQHSYVHTREKPHVCDVCGKSFTGKLNLNNHYLIHTGEKPYVCDICDKNYISKYHFKNHYAEHSTCTSNDRKKRKKIFVNDGKYNKLF